MNDDDLDHLMSIGRRRPIARDIALGRDPEDGEGVEAGCGPDCPLPALIAGWTLTCDERRYIGSCRFGVSRRPRGWTHRTQGGATARIELPAAAVVQAGGRRPWTVDAFDNQGNRLDLDLPAPVHGWLFVRDSRPGETYEVRIAVAGQVRGVAVVTVGLSGWGELELDDPLTPGPASDPQLTWRLDRVDSGVEP